MIDVQNFHNWKRGDIIPEIIIKDDAGNVIDVACDHEFDFFGICQCCGYIKYGSEAYLELYGLDPFVYDSESD